MEIFNLDDRIIKSVFPIYNREKSKLLMFIGNEETEYSIIVKIWRRGTFMFDVKNKALISHKRVE